MYKRQVFNGDNYCQDWVQEAEKRGLPNIPSTVDSLDTILDPEHVAVFERNQVLSKSELEARTEILLENYTRTLNIEAGTTLNMARRQILPSCVAYAGKLAESVSTVESAGAKAGCQRNMLETVCGLIDRLHDAIDKLDKKIAVLGQLGTTHEKAHHCRHEIIPHMTAVRKAADALEMIVDARLWPLPTYAEMLFVR